MFSTPEKYHEYTGDTMINVGKVVDKTTEFASKPRCAEHPPVYS